MHRHYVLCLALCLLGASWAEAKPKIYRANELADYQESPDEGQPAAADPGGETPEGAMAQDAAGGQISPPDDGTSYDDSCDLSDDYCERCMHGGGPMRGFWGRAEYLNWFVRGQSAPPLVTTSGVASAGILNRPDTVTLFPTGRLDGGSRSGARLTMGYWFDECETVGIEGNVFGLETVGTSFNAASDGSQVLARPFFNTATGLQDSSLIAFPGVLAGTINVTTSSKLYGTEINLRRALASGTRARFDMLAGYRFLRFDESLGIAERDTVIRDPNGVITAGTVFDINDHFGTQNQFYGGQLGMISQFQRNRWTVEVTTKAALGAMFQHVNISGATFVTAPGAPVLPSPGGGFLALDAKNIGDYNRSRFSVVPEIDLNLRYQVTDLWRASIGYSLIGVTNVARPADQIDLRINPASLPPTQTPGVRPNFTVRDSDLVIQGINLGLEARF